MTKYEELADLQHQIQNGMAILKLLERRVKLLEVTQKRESDSIGHTLCGILDQLNEIRQRMDEK